MKKFFLFLLVLVIIGGVIGVLFYKFYLPKMVAEVIVEEKTPEYVPEFVRSKIEKYKEPLNKGAHDVVEHLHKSDIPVSKVIDAIDETDEIRIYEALDQLNAQNIRNADEAFDIAKNYIHADFDVEVLREPFVKNVDVKMIRKAIYQANKFRTEESIDANMAKEVFKEMLIRKEREFAGR